MNIVIIGSGNVAWHLAPALEKAGHHVSHIYSRDIKNAQHLANQLSNSTATNSLDFSHSSTQLIIIAISDDAIEKVAQEIGIPAKAVVVHTSGSQPISVLSGITSKRIGVFYPLQTFTKGKKIDFHDVPILVESDNSFSGNSLVKLASQISRNVKLVVSSERLAYHVSAVFACNFTNHLLTMSKELLMDKSLCFDWIKPLIAETVEKALAISPENAQTGPAIRGDDKAIESHKKYLENKIDFLSIYQLITDRIIENKGKYSDILKSN